MAETRPSHYQTNWSGYLPENAPNPINVTVLREISIILKKMLQDSYVHTYIHTFVDAIVQPYDK